MKTNEYFVEKTLLQIIHLNKILNILLAENQNIHLGGESCKDNHKRIIPQEQTEGTSHIIHNKSNNGTIALVHLKDEQGKIHLKQFKEHMGHIQNFLHLH